MEKQTDLNQQLGLILIHILLLCVFPVVSVIVLFYELIKNNNKQTLILFTFSLVMYVSFINASKVISSDPDLPWYTEQYAMAGQMEYLDYIFWFGMNGKGKELFSPTFNYFVYFIVGDNLNLYRFIHSVVCYGLSSFAIIRFCDFYKLKKRVTSLPLVWFVCFPWIFTYSQTLLRQFLACSFLLVIVVEVFCYRRKMVIPFICMFLSHTSSLIFAPFLYLPFFKKKLSYSSFILFGIGAIGLMFIQNIAGYLGSFFNSSDNVLSYVLERASQDTTFELPTLGAFKILFLIASALMCGYKTFNTHISGKNSKQERALYGVCNMIMVFNVFILANINQLELSNRLFLYSAILSFIPFVYFILRRNLSVQTYSLFFWVMNIVLIVYFTHSMGEYDVPFGILIFPMQYIM